MPDLDALYIPAIYNSIDEFTPASRRTRNTSAVETCAGWLAREVRPFVPEFPRPPKRYHVRDQAAIDRIILKSIERQDGRTGPANKWDGAR